MKLNNWRRNHNWIFWMQNIKGSWTNGLLARRTSFKKSFGSLSQDFFCLIIKSKWEELLITTSHHCCKHRDLLYLVVMPIYGNDVRLVGLNFALVFLLDFFQLNNSYFTIDDIIFTGEFVINFLCTWLLCLFLLVPRFSYNVIEGNPWSPNNIGFIFVS